MSRRAKTIEEAAEQMGVSKPSPEELEALEEEGEEGTGEPAPSVTASDLEREVDRSAVPAWVQIPANMEFPPFGVTWTAMRFLAEWTDRPHLGDRQCIVWNLSYGDEKFARRNAKGDAEAVMDEMAKRMIRAIDGEKVNWTVGHEANPDKFWDEIGKRCRMLLLNHFMKTHQLEQAERLHFLANCLVVRTVTPSPTRSTPAPGRGRSTPTP